MSPSRSRRPRPSAPAPAPAPSMPRRSPKAPPRRGTVDRFEGKLAVLVVEGQQVTCARSELPPEVREGDVVDLEAKQVDAEATEALRQQVRAARERAQAGPPAPQGDFEL